MCSSNASSGRGLICDALEIRDVVVETMSLPCACANTSFLSMVVGSIDCVAKIFVYLLKISYDVIIFKLWKGRGRVPSLPFCVPMPYT